MNKCNCSENQTNLIKKIVLYNYSKNAKLFSNTHITNIDVPNVTKIKYYMFVISPIIQDITQYYYFIKEELNKMKIEINCTTIQKNNLMIDCLIDETNEFLKAKYQNIITEIKNDLNITNNVNLEYETIKSFILDILKYIINKNAIYQCNDIDNILHMIEENNSMFSGLFVEKVNNMIDSIKTLEGQEAYLNYIKRKITNKFKAFLMENISYSILNQKFVYYKNMEKINENYKTKIVDICIKVNILMENNKKLLISKISEILSKNNIVLKLINE
ncbi:hypothetical protein TCON_0962 [Astathelohania contejeani]|uniref:Uncharacterized protein n=1 Tax=Astathelohania contejeani TaxID=164912 RepID=A0ABQ7I0A5_9MICR|nr:hypothetical protein TCON_0962 [Thelohania contejeani]